MAEQNLARALYESLNMKIPKIYEDERKLSDMVVNYYEMKKQQEETEKELRELNQRIKERMLEEGLEKFEFDGYTALLIEQNRIAFDNEKLIAKLKELHLEECIQMVEVPNETKVKDRLEDKIIQPEDLVGCIENTRTLALTVRYKEK